MSHHQALQNMIEDQVSPPYLPHPVPPPYLPHPHPTCHTPTLPATSPPYLPHTPSHTQLSLAAIHYLRTHYQEAIDIYKKILLDNRCVLIFLTCSTVLSAIRDMLALNVYLAMCYHKLDYYDVSQEVLASYVQQHTDSVVATNIKACNYYKLYNGKAAEVIKSAIKVKPSIYNVWLYTGRAEGTNGYDISLFLLC